MFAALVAAVWIGDRLTPTEDRRPDARRGRRGDVSRAGPITPDATFVVAVAASLAASLCYAIAGVWLKRHGAQLRPVAIAGWSQLFASLLLLPLAAATPMPGR